MANGFALQVIPGMHTGKGNRSIWLKIEEAVASGNLSLTIRTTRPVDPVRINPCLLYPNMLR